MFALSSPLKAAAQVTIIFSWRRHALTTSLKKLPNAYINTENIWEIVMDYY